jgi:putative heme-binding domain-containing protein
MAVDTPGPGDAARGRALFEGKGACLGCHRVGETGARLGPDLSDVATRMTRDALEHALVSPKPEVSPPNRPFRVTTRDGRTVTGRLLNQDSFSVQMLDSAGRLVSFQRSDLRDTALLPGSPMPSYRGKLTPEEITDVVAYMATLAGPVRQ